MSAAALTLKVGGLLYAGWTSVAVQNSIEQLAGAFTLSLTEKWPGQSEQWEIPAGERCEILIGETPVITGYVDKISVSFDATSHTLSVSGRDAAGDLVDCTAPPLAFTGRRFLDVAQTLCKPYGITVTDETGGSAPLPKCAPQTGETVFRTLEKLARQHGVLLVSDRQGGIVITRAGLAGESGTALEIGKNILSAQMDFDASQLFSEITIKGQGSMATESKFDVIGCGPKGKVTAAPSTSAATSGWITRHRPLVIIAETQADRARCQNRAEWEAGNREAKAKKITVTVQGWAKPDGEIWQINQTIRLIAPWLRADKTWLISGANFQLDEGGSKTTLTLTGEKAFALLPEIPARKGGGKGGSESKYQVIGGKKNV